MNKGTCLLSYLPLRAEPRSGAEMSNSLLFGESYEIIEESDSWLKVRCDYDGYEAWMSRAAYSPYIEYTSMVDALFLEAVSNGAKLYLPCGSKIPDSGKLEIDGLSYTITPKLKTNHHLPLGIRLMNTAKSFLNTPYLWGGRSFMGIDCSGLMQVVFKVNDIKLPRDTSEQIHVGTKVEYGSQKACDLVFFSKPDTDKIIHVGMMLDDKRVIHAGARVRINELDAVGMSVDGVFTYRLAAIKRLL